MSPVHLHSPSSVYSGVVRGFCFAVFTLFSSEGLLDLGSPHSPYTMENKNKIGKCWAIMIRTHVPSDSGSFSVITGQGSEDSPPEQDSPSEKKSMKENHNEGTPRSGNSHSEDSENGEQSALQSGPGNEDSNSNLQVPNPNLQVPEPNFEVPNPGVTDFQFPESPNPWDVEGVNKLIAEFLPFKHVVTKLALLNNPSRKLVF
jgi:hypothetical protein